MKKELKNMKNHIEILNEVNPEVQRIIRRTLKLEYEKMYQKAPRVLDDLVVIVKEEIK